MEKGPENYISRGRHWSTSSPPLSWFHPFSLDIISKLIKVLDLKRFIQWDDSTLPVCSVAVLYSVHLQLFTNIGIP